MTAQRGPINSLTGVRAFAALWVVFFHFRHNAGVGESLEFGAFVQRGYLGVDVFFVLSGLVLAYTYADRFERGVGRRAFVEYLSLRLGRIYPLHAAVLLAYLFLFLAGNAVGFTPLDPRITGMWDGAMSVMMLHAWGFTDRLSWNEASWSISAEWFAYLFVLVPVLRVFRRWGPVPLAALAAASWIVLCYFAMHTTRRSLDFTHEFGALRCAVEFFAGYVVYRIARSHPLGPRAGDLLAAISLAVLAACTRIPGVEAWLLPCVAAFFLGLMARGPVSGAILGNRPAVFLGEISYAIYMVHLLVRIVSNAVMKKLDIDPSPTLAAGLLALQIAVVLALAAAAYYFVEKPAREWVRRTIAASRRNPRAVLAGDGAP